MTNLLKQSAFCFILFFLLMGLTTKAQDSVHHYQSQLSVISENDNYTLKYYDRYYTNGLMVRFSKVLSKNTKNLRAVKKIFNAEMGQMIFTPYNIGRNYQATLDRPYTGFLYAKAGVTNVQAKEKEKVFCWNIIAGLVGKGAQGYEVQTTYHKYLNLVNPQGWDTQLKSEPGINLEASHYTSLFKTKNTKKSFDAFIKSNAIVGTIFTQFSSGFLFRLGALEGAGKSVWWNAHLSTPEEINPSRNYELFLYFEPSVTYQLYNATVQGGMFTHKQDAFTTSIEPFYYRHNFGVMYAQNHWTMQLGFTYKTKEATTMLANENYGTIAFSYCFN